MTHRKNSCCYAIGPALLNETPDSLRVMSDPATRRGGHYPFNQSTEQQTDRRVTMSGTPCDAILNCHNRQRTDAHPRGRSPHSPTYRNGSTNACAIQLARVADILREYRSELYPTLAWRAGSLGSPESRTLVSRNTEAVMRRGRAPIRGAYSRRDGSA